MCGPNASGSPTICTRITSGPRPTASARRPPRCWCAATPTPHPSPMPCAPAEFPVEVVGLAGLAVRPRGRRRGRHAAAGRRPDGRRGGNAGADRSALAPGRPGHRRAVASRGRLGGGRAGRGGPRPSRSRWRPVPTPTAACLADAISDPGPADSYSAAGYQRITALAAELSALRGHLGHSLPDLVAEVRRVLGVDCEVRAAVAASARAGPAPNTSTRSPTSSPATPNAQPPRPTHGVGGGPAGLPGRGRGGRERFAARPVGGRPGPGPGAHRALREGFGVAGGGGGAPVGRDLSVDRVAEQLAHRRRRTAAAAARRPRLGGRTGHPGAGHLGCHQSKAAVGQDLRASPPARSAARRRGAPIALRRHHPGRGHPAGVRPSLGFHRDQTAGPVGFPVRTQGRHRPFGRGRRSLRRGGTVGPAPADGERNPLRDNVVEAVWPADPLAARRGDVERGAALVAEAMSADPADPAASGADVDGWAADVDALLAERARAASPPVARCPASCRSAAWWIWPATRRARRSG